MNNINQLESNCWFDLSPDLPRLKLSIVLRLASNTIFQVLVILSYRNPNPLLSNTRSIIVVIVLGSMIFLYLGIILEIIAEVGIMSLRIIGPNPVDNIPVSFAVPSPVTETILDHNMLVPLGGIIPLDGIFSILLLANLSKYLFIGACNFTKAPVSINFKSVDVNCPVLNNVPSLLSPKYPVT